MANRKYLGNFVINKENCTRNEDLSFTLYQNDQVRSLVDKTRRNNTTLIAQIKRIYVEIPFSLSIDDIFIPIRIVITEYLDKSKVSYFDNTFNFNPKLVDGITDLFKEINKYFKDSTDLANDYKFVIDNLQNNALYKKIDFYCNCAEVITSDGKNVFRLYRSLISLDENLYNLLNIPYAQEGIKVEQVNDIESKNNPKLLLNGYLITKEDLIYFQHQDLTGPNFNNIPITIPCKYGDNIFRESEEFILNTMSSYPTLTFFHRSHDSKVNALITNFMVLISYYEEYFNVEINTDMKYLGNFIINKENLQKINNKYVLEQNNQVRSLVDKCAQKGKKLWVKIRDIDIDTEWVCYITIQETSKDGKEEKYTGLFKINFLKSDPYSVCKYIQENVFDKQINDAENFDYRYNIYCYEGVCYIAPENSTSSDKSITITLNTNLSKILGYFDINDNTHYNYSIMWYSGYIDQQWSSKFHTLTLEEKRLIYIYHPDLGSTNLNNELITCIYNNNYQNKFDFDLMYDVKTISPTIELRFWFYSTDDKGNRIQVQYLPDQVYMLLAFYEGD